MAGSNAITVKPALLTAQMLPGSCGGYPPFVTHFRLIFSPYGYGRFVQGISFSYLDQRGFQTVPIATPGTFEGGIVTTGVPTNGPILVPGQISSIFFVNPSSSGVVPYSVRFKCGHPAKGMLSIGLAMTDQLGVSANPQLAVPIGQ